MPTFESGDVIKVPFPYSGRPIRERRPALVVSSGTLQTDHGLLWVLMITSLANRAWPGDVPVSDMTSSGLPSPSVVRTAKIATIETKEAERIGRLPEKDWTAVKSQVRIKLAGLMEPTREPGKIKTTRR
jgi:mRNA interferase MazF